ncbi:MAG TPA: VWA domain-containing protein [Bryobacteraceae bacterium]
MDMSWRTWQAFAPLALMAGAAILAAQTIGPQEIRATTTPYFPKPAYTIKAETRLVEIGVVVRDGNGHPVSGLDKSDFQVWDNGKQHEITVFSVQSLAPAPTAAAAPAVPRATMGGPAPAPVAAKPRFIALVFDDISMPIGDLFHAKVAAKRFLRSGMAATDRLAVLTTSSGLLLPFTTDKAALSQAIDKVVLRTARKPEERGCPSFTEYEAYVTANHLDLIVLNEKANEVIGCDRGICQNSGQNTPISPLEPPCGQAIAVAVDRAGWLWEQVQRRSLDTIVTLRDIVDYMAQMNGTRVIALASSGFLAGTLESDRDRVIDHALRANVVINSLDAKGLYTEDPQVAGMHGKMTIYGLNLGMRPQDAANGVLAYLAEGTGGSFFHSNNDLDLGFGKLGMQPETSYLLGFTPDPPDGKYHKLRVSLTENRHDDVQARKGYMAVVAPEDKPAPERRIDREAFSGNQSNDVPVTVTGRPDKLESGRPVARVAFHWDAAKMRFQLQDGARSLKLHIVTALLDDRGDFIAGKESALEFALSESTFARAVSGGLNTSMSLQAPAGRYRLRTVVVEDGEAHISANTQAVELK